MVRATRTPGPPPKSDLSSRLRDARLRALLEGPPRRAGQRAATLDQLVDRTAEVYAKALTDHTRQSYASRWRKFAAWADERHLAALPSSAETVMMYLADAVHASPPASLSTLRGRLAAINRVHVEAGHAAPGDDPGMGMLMRGLGRVVDKSPRAEPISALRITQLREVVRALPAEDPRLVRDRALIALSICGVADSHLSRLRWDDVSVRASGLRIGLRDSPSRLPSSFRMLPSRRDPALCPVSALLAWQSLAGVEPEHVFTLVDGMGRRDGSPIHAYNVRRMIGTRLDSLGTDGPASCTQALRLLAEEPAVVVRDRALLLIGFAGAFRRNELCLLRWSDVRVRPDGVVLRLRRSKTDPAGHGREVGIPHGRSALTCPVSALAAWRGRVHRQLGEAWHDELPVLVRVGSAGRIGTDPITPAALTRIVTARARAAELPGHWGGRSLRAGFISTAADLDIPLEQIARQSRHAGLDSLIRYIRTDDPFRRNAAGLVGL